MDIEELKRRLEELFAQVERNEQTLLRHADRHADQAAPDPLAITTSTHARSHTYDSVSDHSGTLAWASVNKTGSSLADLATRAHANLSDAPADAHHAKYLDAEALAAAKAGAGIADDDLVQMDDAGPAAVNDYLKLTAAGAAGRTYAEVKADLDLEIGTDVLAQQTVGIANDNLLEVDDAAAAGGQYARFTANGLEGRTAAEARSDLNGADLDATPGSDHTSSGTTSDLTAGENVVYGDFCYMKSDGKMWKGDADAIATSSVIGMANATIAADASGSFLLWGFARDDTWTWTVGGLIFLSTTAGAATQTAPSGADDVIQILGVATHADRMLFKPELVQVEHTG